MKAARHAAEDEPLDADVRAATCAPGTAAGYLRHLFHVAEPTGVPAGEPAQHRLDAAP